RDGNVPEDREADAVHEEIRFERLLLIMPVLAVAHRHAVVTLPDRGDGMRQLHPRAEPSGECGGKLLVAALQAEHLSFGRRNAPGLHGGHSPDGVERTGAGLTEPVDGRLRGTLPPVDLGHRYVVEIVE